MIVPVENEPVVVSVSVKYGQREHAGAERPDRQGQEQGERPRRRRRALRSVRDGLGLDHSCRAQPPMVRPGDDAGRGRCPDPTEARGGTRVLALSAYARSTVHHDLDHVP